ncbi:MAG: hypothetical protein HYU67_09135 [Flavobacteriia bacterium]|nr:hypothetical protein [Flavobacteriia bacterium]
MKNEQNILDSLNKKQIAPLSESEFSLIKTKVFENINQNRKHRVLKYVLWSMSTAAVFTFLLLAQKITFQQKFDFSTLTKTEIKDFLLEEIDENDTHLIYDCINYHEEKNQNEQVQNYYEDIELEDIEDYYNSYNN